MTPAIDSAARAAAAAFAVYRRADGAARAALLERIAQEIEGLGDRLLEVCARESALPLGRLTGERARTCGQLRLFAGVAREGSWVDARIDPALPDRKPLPRPDLRRMLVPLGPVAVFGASNFPLAFSVAGGDTASALAAGCPVVVKAHPAHPETSELVAGAISRAVAACGLPAGVFSMVTGGAEAGVELVRHPAITAVGFTGSHAAGRALFDAAAARPHPIPVFSEMSSVNPLILLPGAMTERGPAIADGLLASATLGVGQFCTKPGLVFVLKSGSALRDLLKARISACAPGTMLTPGIRQHFEEARSTLHKLPGVEFFGPPGGAETAGAVPNFAATTAAEFLRRPELSREVFGPFFLLIECSGDDELTSCLESLGGQLTGTVHIGSAETEAARPWLERLERLAGRVLVDGFPTGVEVSPAMNHGGPYPATTDVRFTSVGTAAIFRFARPVCYQNLPAALLPPALQDANPLGLLRLVNGVPTRDPVARA